MKLKITILIFTFALQSIYVNAQNHRVIDSLQNELKFAKDTVKVNLTNRIASIYADSEPDSTYKYVSISLKEATKINFERGLAITYEIFGEFYFNKGEYKLADENFNKSLKIYEKFDNNNDNNIAGILIRKATISIKKNDMLNALTLLNKAKIIGNKTTISNCNYSIAYIYAMIENYEKSLFYIFSSLKYYETTKDSIKIAHCNNLMGHIYSNINNDSLALIHYTLSLNISKTRSKRDYAYALGNIGIINNKKGKYELAISIYLKAAEIFIEIDDNYSLANTYNNLGNSYLELKQYQESERYFYLVKNIRTNLNDSAGLATNFLNLGNLYNNNNKTTKALEYYISSVKIATEHHLTPTLRENYYGLFEIYLKQKKYKQAIEYYVKHIEIKDSIFDLEKAKSINNLSISYETEKKDQRINYLNKENDLIKASAEQQKKMFLLLIFILIAISLFVIILTYIYLKLKKSYKQIVKKDTEVIIAEETIGKNIKKINDLKETKNSSEKEIATNIVRFMEEEKIFKDENLSVSVVAAYCNTNPKYISQIINTVFKQRFNSFVNEYRIKYACRLMLKKDLHYTIKAIGNEAGFKSNTTFINSFKENTGVTPSQYLKNLNTEY